LLFSSSLPQAPHLGRQQAIVFALPVEVGRLADPCFRQMSATGMPSVACFRMNAFWASENLDASIAFRSSQLGNHRGKL
jgi:hypothetical protein